MLPCGVDGGCTSIRGVWGFRKRENDECVSCAHLYHCIYHAGYGGFGIFVVSVGVERVARDGLKR